MVADASSGAFNPYAQPNPYGLRPRVLQLPTPTGQHPAATALPVPPQRATVTRRRVTAPASRPPNSTVVRRRRGTTANNRPRSPGSAARRPAGVTVNRQAVMVSRRATARRAALAPPQDPGYGFSGGAPLVATGGGQRGPIGKIRNPVMTIVLSCLCFVYAIIQVWQMVNELKAFRGKDDLNPIFFFIPILNYIELWKLNEKVLDAKRMAGIPNPQVVHPVLYLFFALFILPGDLNEIWQAASGGQLPPAS